MRKEWPRRYLTPPFFQLLGLGAGSVPSTGFGALAQKKSEEDGDTAAASGTTGFGAKAKGNGTSALGNNGMDDPDKLLLN
jgi:hypothetical protein